MVFSFEVNLEQASKAKLRIIKGVGKGREFPVEATPLFIGRGEEVSFGKSSEGPRLDLPDKSRSISRKHTKIVYQGGKYQIVDTSVNGTLLNGQKVSYGDLQNKSTIEIGIDEGAVMLEFILSVKEEAFPLPRPKPQPKPQPTSSPQDNPFLEFTKVIPHFRHGESSKSLVSPSASSGKWFIIILFGILLLFFLILLIF